MMILLRSAQAWRRKVTVRSLGLFRETQKASVVVRKTWTQSRRENARHCERQRSNPKGRFRRKMDCFVALLLAMKMRSAPAK